MAGILESMFRLVYRGRVKAYEGIPGPVPQFPFGTALAFMGHQPWEVCADLSRQYGGLTLIWLGGKPVLVLNDPALIGEVLEGKDARYYKEDPRRALAPVITPFCLFITDRPDWSRRRAAHPFNMPGFGEWLDSRVAVLRSTLEASVERLVAAAEPFELTPALQRLSFDAFAATVFGEAFGDDDYARFVKLGRVGNRRMKPLASLLSLPQWPSFYRDRRLWYDKIAQLIAAAVRDPDPAKGDLVRVLVRRGVSVQGDEFRALLANVFYGGVYSVTSCLVTTLYLLARHPESAAALSKETGELLARSPRFDRAGLDDCPWLDAVLRESLRYLTPVPLMARNVRTTQAVELDGRSIPANTVIFLTNWALHRSPVHWKDPDRFEPSRWLNGGVEANPMGSGYFFPFGRGPRTCVGMPFSLFYLKLALAVFTAHARWEITSDDPYKQSYFFGVRMPEGIRARVVRP